VSRKRRSSRKILGGAVTLGTAGLTSCITSGSVDPPPPPPRCENLNAQRDLSPSVGNEGGVLVASIQYVGREASAVREARVSLVDGATLKQVSVLQPSRIVRVELVTNTPLPSRIVFVLEGTFEADPACPFQRSFTITTDGGLRITESRLALPFAAQPRAAIVVRERHGSRVTLAAIAEPPGRHQAWSVSGGRFELDAAGRMVWQLPSEPGLYQAELFVDHGQDGFAFDTLALELHAERA
jgi:hypothetical protein